MLNKTKHYVYTILYAFLIFADYYSNNTIQCKGQCLPAYLVFTLAEQFLFAKVIDAQQFAHPH